MDDAALLDGLRNADAMAFEQLVRQYGGRLLAVTRRILGHEEDARDALLSAFRSIDGFDGKAQLGTWLHRIAVNAALMKLRTRRRKPERALEDLLPKFLDDGHQADPAAPWDDRADLQLEREETRQLVRESIAQLPDTYRTVLLHRAIEGLDTEETPRLLGVSSSVVKTRLPRARQALRALLDPHFREAQPT